MPPRYGRLEVGVTADTSAMERQIKAAATSSGQQAAKGVSGAMTAGLKGLGGLAGSVGKSVASGLAVAGTAAVGFGVASFKAAARVGEMDATLRALAKANNLSYDGMQQNVKAIRHQGIEAGVAQNVVAQFARNQLDLGKSTDLATVAQNAAVISGQNSSDTLDQLIHGITTQNSLVLRNAGVNVQAGQAMDLYAKKLGKSRGELTDAERAQAVLNAVIEAGGPIAGAYAAAMEEPGKVLRSFPRIINDMMVSVGQNLVKAIGPAIINAYDFAKALSHVLEAGGPLAPVITAIGEAVAKLITPLTKALAGWTKWIKAMRPDQLAGVADKIKQFGPAAMIAAGGLAAMAAPSVLSGLPVIGGLLSNLTGPLALVQKGMLNWGKGVVALVTGNKEMMSGLKGVTGALGRGGLLGPLTAVAAVFALLMVVSPQFRAAVMELVKALAQAFKPVLAAVLELAKALLPPIIGVARALGAALAPAIKALVPLITAAAQVLAWLLRLLGPLAPAIVYVAVAWAAYKVAATGAQAVGAVIDFVKMLPTLVAYVLGIESLTVATIAQGVWTKITAAAQWLLNAALTANPIGLVVVAIGALIAGLVIAYNKLGWFRSIVDSVGAFLAGVFVPVINVVVGAITTLWHWITGGSPGLVPAFLLLRAVIAPVAGFLASVVTGAFNAVRGAVAACVGFISSAWPPLLGVITAPMRAAAGATLGAWGAIRAGVTAAVNAVRGAVSSAWSFLVGVTGQAWAAVRSAVSAAWAACVALLTGGFNWFRAAISAVWSFGRDTTARLWAAIGAVILGAWNGIRSTVTNAATWVTNTLSTLWTNIERTAAQMWGGIVTVIDQAWARVKDVVAEPARFVAFKIVNPLISGANFLLKAVGMAEIKQIPAFAEGGRVPGGWGGGDRQVILAEAGEWVLTKQQAKAIGYGALRHLPRYAEGGEVVGRIGEAGHIGERSHGPTRSHGPLDWIGDLGGKALKLTHMDDLINLGKDVVDSFSGMLKWAAAEAFKALTAPLRKLAEPYERDNTHPWPKQALGKLVITAIDKTVELISSKAAAECDAGGVVAHAMTFEGKPYRWGGPANPQGGFDCSSFVSFIAGSAGLPLPGGFKVPAQSHGPVTTDYMRFSGMTSKPLAAAQPGDVAVNSHHIGFIIGPGGQGFAARSTATGIGKQNFKSGYTYRGWSGGAAAGTGTCEGGAGPDGPPNGFPVGVKNYAGIMAQVCKMLGVPQWTNVFLSQMASESGGNPRAINNWDSNAKKGTPSKGLMQVIDPTFLAYAGPYKSRGIWDPLANIYAAVNYAKSRYGGRVTSVIGHGYARGGIINEHVVGVGQASGEIYQIGEGGRPEAVVPLSGGRATEVGPFTRDRGGGTTVNVYPQPGQSEEQIAAAVSRRLAWADAGGRG